MSQMGQPHKVMRKQKINSHYLSWKIERRKAIQKDEPVSVIENLCSLGRPSTGAERIEHS
ncbi:hypothetical protein BPJM79_10113 [Bacillus pumilus]